MHISTENIKSQFYQAPTGRVTVFCTTPDESQALATASKANLKEAIDLAVRFTVQDLMKTLAESDHLDEDTATLLAIEYGIDQVDLRKIMNLSSRNKQSS